MPRPLEITIDADTSGFREAMDDLERSAGRVGSALGDALKGATVRGLEFEDVLRKLALKLSTIALDAALQPLERGASGLFSQLAEGLAGAIAPRAAPALAPAVAPSVTLNVTTPNAESFRRAEGQIVAMVARSALRGRRSL